ncbi:protein mono-ADP-ribosyltransferase PARP12 [Hippoglossus stenolepis]|uniref:protein mono-ADP-ribosyltransferase PARP12 n=1 Tax=Hippoglossus stenolepis TaxID=195615 RepID=UPI00159C2EC0|nr:protein mono-ADP-ribosyltransferase PARP12 [Hippoglossus stenolepis]
MMTSPITTFVIKTLCDHQGSLDSKQLNEQIARSFPDVSQPVLRSVLFDDGKICIRSGRGKAAGGQMISPDSLLVAKTSLRLCQKKPGECPQCECLHLCRYYVCGDCTFGSKCIKNHSLATPYNADILKRFGLQDFTEKQLFQLLLQNDPFLLPEICPHYNKGNGEHGTCKFSTSCTKLHVCQHFIQGDCKFSSSCKRIHNIDAKGMKILSRLSQETINNLHEIYRNKCIIMGQSAAPVPAPPGVSTPPQLPSDSVSGSPAGSACQSKPTTDTDRNEICLFFIRRHCSFKEKCVRVHWHLPYKWQVLDSDGVTWKDLPDMEDIEKAYCDPGNDASCTSPEVPSSGIFNFYVLRSSLPAVVKGVDFVGMKYGGSPVRRLSTASSVSKPPHFILTTQWLWSWKDEQGIWLEYGQGDQQASVTSETLENLYLAEGDTEIPFGAGKQKYVLHFKAEPGKPPMYQENLKYKTKREVRRRPGFVSAQDVKVKLERASSHSSSSSSSMAESVPSYWDIKALPDFGFKHILLTNSAKDYTMIEKLFRVTMPLSKINSINRIQNPSLWKVFQWQKEQMTARNGGKAVNQQYLFHGTDASLIQAISEQNFDWRMCGVHGVAYGKGSYFARDASYSDKYARAKSSQNKIMFVALVLVGEYSQGSSSFVRPPPKGNVKTFYDSCVDNVSKPSIYVVFEKQQIYPEYVIDYS